MQSIDLTLHVELSTWDMTLIQSTSPSGSHARALTRANTLWMWNIIMHKTGSMSVSYEPAMKPLVDKSPPTGVKEFGSLMKKSCWAGRSWPAWLWGFGAPCRGPNRRGAMERTGEGVGAGLVAQRQCLWTVWEFTTVLQHSKYNYVSTYNAVHTGMHMVCDLDLEASLL